MDSEERSQGAARQNGAVPIATAVEEGSPPPAAATTQPWAGTSLQQLRRDMQAFADERNWNQFHTPRNLLLALTGEVGELAELFQWRGEVACGLPGFTAAERQHVGEELSDVLLYLVRLADACGIDLAAAALSKMQANAKKYPAHLARGSSDKYTRYAALKEQHQREQQAAAEGQHGQVAEGRQQQQGT